MCGIAGVLYFDQRPVTGALLRAMGNAIAHRGPDADGYFSAPGIGLVHRRLSIIDVAGGNQPIANEDGSIHVVFNGELYNYHDLRKQLQHRGHLFNSESDTECLVHSYEDHGRGLVESLRGMFSFAIWDNNTRTLTLGRDRLGLKPLYYYRDSEKFVFGSELKAIFAHPDVKGVLDIKSVDAYFCLGMVPGHRSIYQNIRKMQPAHTMAVDFHGRVDSAQYWSYEPHVDSALTEEQWLEKASSKIEDAVRSHLVSDVPVGAFLSGGIDSTVIASVAAEISGTPLQTFSIGFSDSARSELPFASETAQRLGGVHREAIVEPNAASDLDTLVDVFDEPFADSSAIPTMRVAQLAAEHVKVVLTGDGGDECFGGYARYVHDLAESRFRAKFPNWLRTFLLRPLAYAWPHVDWLPRLLRGKSFLTNISSPPSLAYAQTIANCTARERRKLYTGETREMLGLWTTEKSLSKEFRINDKDPLAGMLAADVQCLLPDAFLVKVDRATMAHGLEARPPLLDHELLELSARIPSNLKIRGSDTKWILKRAMRRHLPESLLNRPKQGFEIPLDQWLAGPLFDVFRETALSPTSGVCQIFDRRVIQRLLEAHTRGVRRCGQLLWNILVFAKWFDRYQPQLPRS